MGVFGDIMNAIFGKRAEAGTASGQASGQATIDVEKILNERAAQNKQKLDWRHSIVDLMKLLDLDSSQTARKQLATELKYDGDINNSAKMNIWLHKHVMHRLAENGGKVPDALKQLHA
jgi:hypothetical protein